MCAITINTSAQKEHSEINISGTAAGFVSLANDVAGVSMRTYSLKNRVSSYFPVSISQLSVEPVSQSNGLITARIHGADLTLSGDLPAFQKLADFLASLSNLRPSEHFHLDWFANGDLLAPETATMSFVFSVEA